MEFSKEKRYVINGRIGQYELTTLDEKRYCFFMDDSCEYEYFDKNSNLVVTEFE